MVNKFLLLSVQTFQATVNYMLLKIWCMVYNVVYLAFIVDAQFLYIFQELFVNSFNRTSTTSQFYNFMTNETNEKINYLCEILDYLIKSFETHHDIICRPAEC